MVNRALSGQSGYMHARARARVFTKCFYMRIYGPYYLRTLLMLTTTTPHREHTPKGHLPQSGPRASARRAQKSQLKTTRI